MSSRETNEADSLRRKSLQITAVIVGRDEQSQMRTNSLQISAVIIRRDFERTCYKSLQSTSAETNGADCERTCYKITAVIRRDCANELVTNHCSHRQEKRMELTANELVTDHFSHKEYIIFIVYVYGHRNLPIDCIQLQHNT